MTAAIDIEELKRECERARERVAADPDDALAARELREVVRRFALAAPHRPQSLPEPAPDVATARKLVSEGKLEEAEIILRKHLKSFRHDFPAMHLMAEIAAKCDLREDAERILREAARIHAGSVAAWTSLGTTLHRIACEKDYPEFVHRAVDALDQALTLNPEFEPALAYKAAVFIQTRGLDRAREALERLLAMCPRASMHWLNYGYVLKTVGEFGKAVSAYRTSAALDKTNGAAWWGMADLKIAKFFEFDIEDMEAALESMGPAEAFRIEICFSVAKALDQAGAYERAARWLEEGNRLRAASPSPEASGVGSGLEFNKRTYSPAFYSKRKGWGDPRPDPIFIVGMPRAGSTLVEQILASHSAIEGTEELFILHQLENELCREHPSKTPEYLVSSLSESDFTALGARYLELATRSRQTDKPLFTDKNPANWRYLGLIHCMLPNAKIIDVRRNPMDCCFANYGQHYRSGANFTYDQKELGRYYAEYVEIMRHFDEVLSGRVHRLIHDDLVDNFEHEVRRLLDYVGVPFEETCLRFYETQRPVHTPSSEQVRRPINRSGFGRWRNYEPWLSPLRDALGEAATNWRS